MKKINVKAVKLIFSIAFGLVITFLFAIFMYDYFNLYYRDAIDIFIEDLNFIVFVCIIYFTIIIFLILWNKIKSKFVYLLLAVPIIYTLIDQTIIYKYKSYKYGEYLERIKNIPAVKEIEGYDVEFFYDYAPFYKDNLLVKLDEKSDLEITDNMPFLDGATAFFPVYASFYQTVYPKGFEDYRIFCSKTDKAFEQLWEGKADIIFCFEPSDLQIKKFKDKNIKLIPIGREAFVFFVNKENPIDNLTIENIRDIYSGKIKNWKKLNGINQDIIAYQRPKNSGSQTILEKIMGNKSIITPHKEYVAYGMDDIIKIIANYRNFQNAIGYSFLFYSTEMVKNDQIKLLSINGIYPSVESIQNGSYPFIEDFYAIYIDSDNKNENIDLFIEWILSNQGQTIISKTGYIPIN
jgi:phosphate transport system substrate-binding protein